MHTELKKAIVDFIFENLNNFQLISSVKQEFRQYIYAPKGDYCIGGKDVGIFIDNAIKLIKN